jgi:DNA-binding CsgD family transcriptional regulator
LPLARAATADAHSAQLIAHGASAASAWRRYSSLASTASAVAALASGNYQAAADYSASALRHQDEMDDQWGQTWSLELCAWIIAARLDQADNPRGEAERAAWLLGAAGARQHRLGVNLAGLRPLAAGHARAHQQIAAVLSEAEVSAALSAGSRGNEQAARVALGESTTRRPATPSPGLLTTREREVAELVAEGLTSPQIAAQLFISTRTVNTHIGNIMTKLGFHRRTAIATWIVTQSDGRSVTGIPTGGA